MGEGRAPHHRGPAGMREQAGAEGRRPARIRGEFGAATPGAPRPELMGRLDDIVARLSRIEGKLGGHPAGAPHADGHPPRPPMPQVPGEMREMFENRMQEARKRMEEGRERMEQARKKFQEMEERIRKLEAEVERLKAAK